MTKITKQEFAAVAVSGGSIAVFSHKLLMAVREMKLPTVVEVHNETEYEMVVQPYVVTENGKLVRVEIRLRPMK